MVSLLDLAAELAGKVLATAGKVTLIQTATDKLRGWSKRIPNPFTRMGQPALGWRAMVLEVATDGYATVSLAPECLPTEFKRVKIRVSTMPGWLRTGLQPGREFYVDTYHGPSGSRTVYREEKGK